jgi:glycosyltransferase involved in cell wall biosynthesis
MHMQSRVSPTASSRTHTDVRVPDISLVLATVGRIQELDRLFDSLAAQTFTNFEVIVVDQNTDERLRAPLERARYLGISVRHIKHHPANLAAARNAGIDAAHGQWIGFPDDDCWYDPQVLARVAGRFVHDDRPSAVIVRWVEQGEQPLTAVTLRWKRARAFRDVPVSSITLFCERDLFRRIGGFDARLGVGQWYGAGEETDFVFRALRSHAVLSYDPKAEVHHAVNRHKPEASKAARALTRHRARGTGALYAKHRLPLWVIARGLVAPVLLPMIHGKFGTELAHGYAEVRGRVDGWLRWRQGKV